MIKRVYITSAIAIAIIIAIALLARRPGLVHRRPASTPAHVADPHLAATPKAPHEAHVGAPDLPKPMSAFIEAHCLDCHDASTNKGSLNFESLAANLDEAPLEAKWTLIFDRVQRGEMPPKKEPQPSGDERTGFVKSLGALLTDHDTARRAGTGRVALRRLNRIEYENTVHDLLAIDTPLVDLLPEDGSARGFDNVSEGLRLSASQIESYLTAADAALDDAINLKPQPERQTDRVEFLQLPRLVEALGKKHREPVPNSAPFTQNFRALPDAVAMFVNQANKSMAFGVRANAPGQYHVRLSAYGYQNEHGPTVAAKLLAGDYKNYRLLGAYDLPSGTPRIIDTTVHLNPNEMLVLAAAGCGLAADGTEVAKVGGETFTGSGIAFQWAEIEGPLIASWPPASVQRVFGDIPVRPRAAAGISGPGTGSPDARAYEIAHDVSVETVDKVITAFAQRAFRHPLKPDDVERYTRLANDALAAGANVETALRRAYKTILTSPEFLFLRESPGQLDDYALASRLSYFLWSTMPDEELLRLAANGTLHDPATLRAQTERLLADPRAHTFAKNFCGQWLNLRAIDATMPNNQLYPEFDVLLQNAMVTETESFFDEIVRHDLPAATFIDSDFAMLNRRLAEHYGIAGVRGEEFRKVALPAGSHRGGLLTQASVLKVTANGTLSSPVVRGAWVMKRILGREPQPPPPDAGSIEPDTRGATTIREQLAKHRRAESCAGCHRYMDPYGFALENYDVIGGWREAYRRKKGPPVIDPYTHRNLDYSLGPPVDATGELADGRKFANIEELKNLLLDQQDTIARNLVNNLVAYSTGAGVTFSDRPLVDDILQQYKAAGYPVRTLVNAIVQSPLFQTK